MTDWAITTGDTTPAYGSAPDRADAVAALADAAHTLTADPDCGRLTLELDGQAVAVVAPAAGHAGTTAGHIDQITAALLADTKE